MDSGCDGPVGRDDQRDRQTGARAQELARKPRLRSPELRIAPPGARRGRLGINAIIDLLAESDDALVIVDHKTGPCPDPEARFGSYLPQLEAYAGLLASQYPYKPVRFLAINWMDEGQISFIDTANLITEKAA
ncbi:PD-(D/E)XK nuclease family protein [Sinorhizobium psoraleae]|uniref:PD-(D/E)XK nuclease family protein n=1 Tax=Sinorhizobium psoraleae TaxID=520838 RepID=A0ABT4K9Z5_9HYPH|nr:PD-(D/E)XK nuclease family protein [Sinorhizobium psoraleae]MCZ4088742.1 PD-(D/E)XK nuclease family protein [Sinorhizobium psoraleae]